MLKVKKKYCRVREPSTDSQQSGSASGKCTSCLSSWKQIQKYKYAFYLKCVLAFYLLLSDTWDNRLFSLQWKKHPLKGHQPFRASALWSSFILRKLFLFLAVDPTGYHKKVLLSPDFFCGNKLYCYPLEVLISVWIIFLLILLVCEPLRVFLYD